MGKYSSSSMTRKPDTELRSRRIHPVWRGIGFIFAILIPVMAYYTTLVVLDANNQKGWFQIPADLYFKGAGDPLIYVKIMGTIAIGFLFYAFFMLLNFIIYSIFAPPRYGPTDVPPMHYRRVKR